MRRKPIYWNINVTPLHCRKQIAPSLFHNLNHNPNPNPNPNSNPNMPWLHIMNGIIKWGKTRGDFRMFLAPFCREGESWLETEVVLRHCFLGCKSSWEQGRGWNNSVIQSVKYNAFPSTLNFVQSIPCICKILMMIGMKIMHNVVPFVPLTLPVYWGFLSLLLPFSHEKSCVDFSQLWQYLLVLKKQGTWDWSVTLSDHDMKWENHTSH